MSLSITGINRTQNVASAKAHSEGLPKLPSFPKDISIYLSPVLEKVTKNFLPQQYQQLKELLKTNKNSSRIYFELGENFFAKKIYQKAKENFKRALDIDPSLLGAYKKLITISLLEKKIEDLEYYQEKLVKHSHRRSDFLHDYILLKVARHPTDQEMLKGCLKDIQEVVEKDPKNALFLNTFGFLHLTINTDLDVAQEYFQKALRIDPALHHALNNLGVILLKKKLPKKAVHQFEVCINKNPQFSIAYENLASVYILEKNFKHALDILQKAVKKGIPVSQNLQHMNAWLLLRNGRYDEAIAVYNILVQKEKENNLLYNNLGYCFLKKGNKSEALSYFRKAVKIVDNRCSNRAIDDKRALEAFYNLCRISLDDRDLDTVNETFNKLKKWDEQDPYVLYLSGFFSYARNDIESAIEGYKEAIEINPYLPDPYPDLSFILGSKKKDYKLVVDLLQGAKEKGLEQELIENNLAHAYIRLGKLNLAEKIVKRFSDKSRAELLATKGMLKLRQKKLSEGDALYREAIEKMRTDSKQIATQIWHYERGRYFFKSKEYEKALEELDFAQAVGEKNSYMNDEISDLQDEILEKSARKQVGKIKQ